MTVHTVTLEEQGIERMKPKPLVRRIPKKKNNRWRVIEKNARNAAKRDHGKLA